MKYEDILLTHRASSRGISRAPAYKYYCHTRERTRMPSNYRWNRCRATLSSFRRMTRRCECVTAWKLHVVASSRRHLRSSWPQSCIFCKTIQKLTTCQGAFEEYRSAFSRRNHLLFCSRLMRDIVLKLTWINRQHDYVFLDYKCEM